MQTSISLQRFVDFASSHHTPPTHAPSDIYIDNIMFKYILVATACMVAAVVMAQSEADKLAEVIKLEADNNPDGSYAFAYETSNGIAAQESGIGGEQATGGFKWISPEGQTIDIQYTAGPNGYVPTGDAIPVAPEVPAHVARLVEYLAAHPNNDDGSYKP